MRVHIIISGYVQGVGFRYFINKKAFQLGIKGWVKNTPNGSVEVMAEGNEIDIQTFIEYCKKGPNLASIKDVKINYEELSNEFKNFEVRY